MYYLLLFPGAGQWSSQKSMNYFSSMTDIRQPRMNSFEKASIGFTHGKYPLRGCGSRMKRDRDDTPQQVSAKKAKLNTPRKVKIPTKPVSLKANTSHASTKPSTKKIEDVGTPSRHSKRLHDKSIARRHQAEEAQNTVQGKSPKPSKLSPQKAASKTPRRKQNNFLIPVTLSKVPFTGKMINSTKLSKLPILTETGSGEPGVNEIPMATIVPRGTRVTVQLPPYGIRMIITLQTETTLVGNVTGRMPDPLLVDGATQTETLVGDQDVDESEILDKTSQPVDSSSPDDPDTDPVTIEDATCSQLASDEADRPLSLDNAHAKENEQAKEMCQPSSSGRNTPVSGKLADDIEPSETTASPFFLEESEDEEAIVATAATGDPEGSASNEKVLNTTDSESPSPEVLFMNSKPSKPLGDSEQVCQSGEPLTGTDVAPNLQLSEPESDVTQKGKTVAPNLTKLSDTEALLKDSPVIKNLDLGRPLLAIPEKSQNPQQDQVFVNGVTEVMGKTANATPPENQITRCVIDLDDAEGTMFAVWNSDQNSEFLPGVNRAAAPQVSENGGQPMEAGRPEDIVPKEVTPHVEFDDITLMPIPSRPIEVNVSIISCDDKGPFVPSSVQPNTYREAFQSSAIENEMLTPLFEDVSDASEEDDLP